MTGADSRTLEQRFAAQGFIKLLRDLERRPLEDLVRYQARRLEELARHARAWSPFYKDRLAPAFDRDDHIDFARWNDVPILTRADAQANGKALAAEMIPAKVGNYIEDQTSGSGGSAFHFLKSAAALVAESGNSLRIYLDHRFDADATYADIRLDLTGTAIYPDGEEREDWSHGEGSGRHFLLDINTPTDHQIEFLIRHKVRILFTWASNARQIALRLEETGQRLDLANLGTSAEFCTEATREDCLRVFGTAPVDVFGVRELGIVAFPCHAAPVYHFTAESGFFEAIADDGRPASPGEPGRLVGTSLYSYHMPFIRYATGDYVTLADGRCACGRSLPTVTAIHGRDRNRFRRRNGSLAFPDIPERAFDAIFGAMDWQLVQTGKGRCAFRVTGDRRPAGQDGFDALRDLVGKAVGEPVVLSIVEAAKPAPPRRKREKFIRETDSGPASAAG